MRSLTRGKTSGPEDRNATRPPLTGGLARCHTTWGSGTVGSVSSAAISQPWPIDLAAIDLRALRPGAIGHSAGRMLRHAGGLLLRHGLSPFAGGIGRALELGTNPLRLPADRVQNLGGPISPAEPEGEAEGQRHTADKADENGIDQGGGDAELGDGDHDGKPPHRDSRHRLHHLGIAEAGFRGRAADQPTNLATATLVLSAEIRGLRKILRALAGRAVQCAR